MNLRVCAADACSVSLDGQHANRRFCSVRCRRGYRSPSEMCEACRQPNPNTDGRSRYCSAQCRRRRAPAPPVAVCKKCGVTVPAVMRADARFCSRTCRLADWRIRNPARTREIASQSEAARRARVLRAFVEDVDRTVVWDRDNGVCHICLTAADKNDWHLDHVIPLVKGGLHAYFNVAVSHPICNMRKGARLIP